MRRFAVIVALGALLGMFGGAATATPALAAGGRGDGWQFVDFRPGFTTDSCGFPIVATIDVDNVFGRALTAPDGSMIFQFNGAFKITWTANGKSISTNAPGPFKSTVSPDGMTTTSAGTGLTALVLTPADAAVLGVPPVFVFAGRGTATLDAAGNIISGSIVGHILVNLCAALS